MCSSRKYPYPPPPRPKGGRRKFREERGGPTGDNFRGAGGGGGRCLQRFFPGGLSKIAGLLTNNSFSVEQAISYFTVTDVSKQVS